MRRTGLAITGFLCCVAFSAIAQTTEHRTEGMILMPPEGWDYARSVRMDPAALDSSITSIMDTCHIPGVAACVVKDGQVAWSGSYGWANIEDSIEVQDSTLFMLASVSKPFTGVALMQLWEEGLFGLDEDINDYLDFDVIHPWYPDSAITFRMLLTHTSGIRDNWGVLNSLYVLGDSPIPLGQFLEDYLVPGGAYYNSTSNFYRWDPPGTAYHYCNVAVALAGYLVEAVSGTPFDQYCEDSLFIPLQMDETAWFLADLDTSHIAMPYHWNGSTYEAYGHYGYPDYPDGQLRTSSLQIARFLIAFMQGGQIDGVRILDSTTVDTMTTVQFPVPGGDIGLIWFRYWLNELNDWYWGHGGSDMGCRTQVFYCPSPAENWGVVILTNGESDQGNWLLGWELLYFAREYLCPMALEIELLNSTTARLSWSRVTGATQYTLYRQMTPYFSAGGAPWRTVAAPTTYTDFTDGLGDPGTNYFFIGIASNAAQTSSESNTVGEFDLSTSTMP